MAAMDGLCISAGALPWPKSGLTAEPTASIEQQQLAALSWFAGCWRNAHGKAVVKGEFSFYNMQALHKTSAALQELQEA